MKVLDRSWINCLRMWKWITENLPEGFSASSERTKEFVIGSLKRQWLRENKFTKPLSDACFFCEYDKKHGDECGHCPAGLVKRGFRCTNCSHHFAHNPVAFYHLITKLDSRRRSRGRDS